MKFREILIIADLFLMAGACHNTPGAPEKAPAPIAIASTNSPDTSRHVQILDPEALSLLDSNAVIDIIAKGYKWSEGPVYANAEKFLLFSDVPANRIYRWKADSGATIYLEPAGSDGAATTMREPGSNGLVIDRSGHLVLCQQGYRRIARMKSSLLDPKPVFEAVASTYKGKKFNSPNDLVYAKNGSLYFTDPPYGLKDGLKDSTKELAFQGVFCVKPDGKISLVSDKISYPNGIALSPDNKFLFIANSDNDNKEWVKFELNDRGVYDKQTVFYHISAEEGKMPGNPDGMKINSKGYVFATGPGGIWVFNPAGKVIARIYTGQLTANCAFDQAEKTLYMTCNSLIMKMKLK